MIQITPKNLTSAPINWALLPKGLQAEKDNLELYEEFYDEEPSIKENVDKLIEVIKKTHAEKTTPAPKKAKGVKKLPPTKTPAKTKLPRKKKKAAKKPVAAKKRGTAKKAAKKVVRKVARRKTVRKVANKEKAPVTVKKLSAELQLIKNFAAWHGKSRKVSTVKAFLKRLESVKKNANVSSQKSLLGLIAGKIKSGLANLSKDAETIGKVTLTADILDKCKAAVKNAKPRLQVQYLSGLKGKK